MATGTSPPPGGGTGSSATGGAGASSGSGTRPAGQGTSNRGRTRSSTTGSRGWTGDISDMGGHIYDVSTPKQVDMYTKTTERLIIYVGDKFEHYSGDMVNAITNLKNLTINPPARPTPGTDGNGNPIPLDAMDIEEWKQDRSDWRRRVQNYNDNLQRLYAVIWGQCTEAMKAKVQAMPDYSTFSVSRDGIELLKSVRTAVHNFQSHRYAGAAIHSAVRELYMFSQRNMTPTQYLEAFQNRVEVIEQNHGTIGRHDALKDIVISEGVITDVAAAYAEGRELATAFIMGADRSRYSRMIESLENDYLQGIDKWPKSLSSAHTLLTNWRQDPRNASGGTPSNSGVSFATTDGRGGKEVNLANSGGNSDIECYRCGERGHIARNCDRPPRGSQSGNTEGSGTTNVQEQSSGQGPTSGSSGGTTSGVSNVTVGHQLLNAAQEGELDDQLRRVHFSFLNQVSMQQNSDAGIPSNWILLDSQNTLDVFKEGSLLTNIRDAGTSVHIHCTAGVAVATKQGDLEGYGTVWYHPEGIANILSLARVKERFRVTFDSTDGNAFVVHKPNGSTRRFEQSDGGLYYLCAGDGNPQEGQEVGLVTTVEDNRSRYTPADYSRAELARSIQRRIGRPSTKDFIKFVEDGALPNCPITRRDIMAAEDIFGADLGSLKGKTVRAPPRRVITPEYGAPPAILDRYRDITLCADIMFVNRIPFFMTISRNIRFRTAEALGNQRASTLLQAMKNVKAVYNTGGFQLRTALMDGQFEPLRDGLMAEGIQLNTVAADEHVGEIERTIRTVKERVRAIWNTLPFMRMPKVMVTEMILSSVFWLNAFPVQGGVSANHSPRTIMSGTSVDYHRHCQLEFGAYVQVHEKHDNSMAPRTTGAIALRPTGNLQGGYYFMSLTTGRRLARNHWTELPMPAEVIDRVHQLAGDDNLNGILFADRNGNPLEELFDEAEPNPDDIPAGEAVVPAHMANNPYAALIPDDEDEGVVGIEPAGIADHPGDWPDNGGGDEPNLVEPDDDDDPGEPEPDEVPDDVHEPPAVVEVDPVNDLPPEPEPNLVEPNLVEPEPEVAAEPAAANQLNPAEQAALDEIMDERYGPRGREGLRPRREVNYDHLFAQHEYLTNVLNNIMLTQHTMKIGLELYGEDAVRAVLKELRQLDERGCVAPVDPNNLTREEKRRALHYLMFIKKKRDGSIKARGCADGRKQRLWTPKESAASPTVAIESLFISCALDAKEGRDVATSDVPGAFMQADNDEIVHMRLEGKMAELFIEVDPKRYGPYSFTDSKTKKTVLYVRLVKALYGTLRAAFLFWQKLSTQLEDWGFKINPYDWCVANKVIDGHQCTVLWHVDDLKISHVDPNVVTSVLDDLNQVFGKEAPMTVTRGKVHDYLGMTIDYTEPGKVKFTMTDYIEGMLNELPEGLRGSGVAKTSPAANHLFEVSPDADKLDEVDLEEYHHNTAKLLFLGKRARPDIQTAVSFLCTRVKCADVDDWKKLKRVMDYLRGTIDMPLVLEANDATIVRWWVDASFAVHPNMRGHTGGMMSLGKGAFYATSTRQKLVTWSSTEAELVGVSEVLPQVIWTRYFLQEQGYTVNENTVYQDNQSAILLEKNGRGSSSKRTRHINIRYFFVTDRVRQKEVCVEYCPTGEMVGDFFTKPLQGAQFRKLRALIMNHDIDDPNNSDLDPKAPDPRSVLGIVDIGGTDKVAHGSQLSTSPSVGHVAHHRS